MTGFPGNRLNPAKVRLTEPVTLFTAVRSSTKLLTDSVTGPVSLRKFPNVWSAAAVIVRLPSVKPVRLIWKLLIVPLRPPKSGDSTTALATLAITALPGLSVTAPSFTTSASPMGRFNAGNVNSRLAGLLKA